MTALPFLSRQGSHNMLAPISTWLFFFFSLIASLLLSNTYFFSGFEEGPAEDFKLRE